MSLAPPRPQDECVLVTGASGFLGSRIVRCLLAQGRQVVGLVHSNPPHVRLNDARQAATAESRLVIVTADLHDGPAVADLVADHRPPACIHAAWDVTPGRYLDSPENDRWVESSLRLHEALYHHGCTWFGALGTCLEHRADERGSSAYATAKVALRRRLFERSRVRGGAVAWLRLFQPYGPFEHADRFLPSLLRAAFGNEAFTVRSPHAVRDFVHADDIADAAVCCFRARLHGSFDVGTGIGRRVDDVARLVADRSPMAPRFRIEPASPDAPEDVLVADPAPLAAACDWRATVRLEDALDTIMRQAAPRIPEGAAS